MIDIEKEIRKVQIEGIPNSDYPKLARRIATERDQAVELCVKLAQDTFDFPLPDKDRRVWVLSELEVK